MQPKGCRCSVFFEISLAISGAEFTGSQSVDVNNRWRVLHLERLTIAG